MQKPIGLAWYKIKMGFVESNVLFRIIKDKGDKIHPWAPVQLKDWYLVVNRHSDVPLYRDDFPPSLLTVVYVEVCINYYSSTR